MRLCPWLVLALGCGPIYPASSPQTQQPSDPTYGQPGYGYGQASSGYGNGQSASGSRTAPPSYGAGQGPGYGQQPGYGAEPAAPGNGPPGSVAPAAPIAPVRPAPPAAPPPPVATRPTSSVAQALVAAHNKRRGRHCAQPLAWSPGLADVAQRWANSLRDQGCKFGHSNGQYGENLAGGSTGTLDPEAVVAMWYDEIKDFSFKSGGFSMSTGHFTQVVWRATSQVGCGSASCNGMDIWVCEYDPPGNVEGDYRQNVVSGADCR